MFGAITLANYVAGSRVYNIFLLFLFVVINDVFLKGYKKNLDDNCLESKLSKDIYKFGLFICPVFVISFLNAEFIVEILFSNKYSQAADVLRVFSVFGFFQILYVLIYQVSLLKISLSHSLNFNLISIVSVVISFYLGSTFEVNFLMFIKFFVVAQIILNIGFLIWFLNSFAMQGLIKNIFVVIFINLGYVVSCLSVSLSEPLYYSVASTFFVFFVSCVLFQLLKGVQSLNCR